MDAQMPGMDGIEATHCINVSPKSRWGSDIPLLLLAVPCGALTVIGVSTLAPTCIEYITPKELSDYR